jgi:hypothetical protein
MHQVYLRMVFYTYQPCRIPVTGSPIFYRSYLGATHGKPPGSGADIEKFI